MIVVGVETTTRRRRSKAIHSLPPACPLSQACSLAVGLTSRHIAEAYQQSLREPP